MDKQERKLKDFLKAFREEFLNVIDFLDKKTFHRGELNIVIKNVCSNVEANAEEKEEIIEILDLNEPVKVSSEEEDSVVQNSTETLENDGGVGYARTYRSGSSHSSLPVSDDKTA
jgi:hypothetical protein